jgi:hypothetical protein
MVNNKKRDKGQNTMLLKDVNSSRHQMFGKLNKLIKKQFGFSISENISYSRILETTSLINREISELKLDKSLRESPELTKLVLMRDALCILKENYDMQPQVNSSNPYRTLMDGMVDAVVDAVCLGDSFADAVKFAMREYRSSKWRFPDDKVEMDLKQLSRAKIVSKCSTPIPHMNESQLSVTFTTDDMDAIHTWLSNVGTDLCAGTRGKLQDFYQAKGQIPHPETNSDDFYADCALSDLYAPEFSGTSRTLFKVNEMRSNIVKKLRTLLETEVAEAEIIATARSFASEVQEMIEKLSRLQNEELPPLTDSMKEEFGISLANNFHSKSQAALQGALEALYSAKDEIDNSVISIATGKTIGNDMDMDISTDPSMSADPDVGGEQFDSLAGLSGGDDEESLGDIGDIEDEFGGSDAMTGTEEPLGRAKRESIRNLKNAIMEMEQKLAKLSKKKNLG